MASKPGRRVVAELFRGNLARRWTASGAIAHIAKRFASRCRVLAHDDDRDRK